MASGLKYDAFLSFRGSDTRKGITSELHYQLTERGIETYMDTNLRVGNRISPALLQAIEESRFAIVILSPNYASSTWCLQEITKICASMEYNDRILPLFYNVEPDDILLLKGSFEEAFTNYENDGLYRSEKLQEWKDALKKVANCKGWNLRNFKTERELVKNIVEDMYSKVKPNENNKRDLEATREAQNKAQVASVVNASGSKIYRSNVNSGTQGDVVTGVGGDFIKDVRGDFIKDVRGDFIKDVRGDFNKGGPSGDIVKGDKGGPGGDIVKGDKGGRGGDGNNGGFGGAGGSTKGNITNNGRNNQ